MPPAKQPPPRQVVAVLDRLVFSAQRDELPYGYVQSSLALCGGNAAGGPGVGDFRDWIFRVDAVIAPSIEAAGLRLRRLVQNYLANCHWRPRPEHFEFELRSVDATDGTFDAGFGVYAAQKLPAVGPVTP